MESVLVMINLFLYHFDSTMYRNIEATGVRKLPHGTQGDRREREREELSRDVRRVGLCFLNAREC